MIIFNLLFLATGISALLIDRQSENSNRECAHWCSENFRNPGAVCTSLAAQGRGPCFECGPAAPKPHTHLLCHEECVPIDNDNCGSCGNKCDEGTVCDDSKCVHSCEASSNIIAPRFERAAYDGRLDFRDIDDVLNLECCKECYETENCAFWWMANEVFGPCTLAITSEESGIGESDQCQFGLWSGLEVYAPAFSHIRAIGKGPCLNPDGYSVITVLSQ